MSVEVFAACMAGSVLLASHVIADAVEVAGVVARWIRSRT